MVSNTSKLTLALGFVGAIALSAASADARDGYRTETVRGALASEPYAWRSPGPYAYQPSAPYASRPFSPFIGEPTLRDAYGYVDGGVGTFGTGTFSDGRTMPRTNWNPNQ